MGLHLFDPFVAPFVPTVITFIPSATIKVSGIVLAILVSKSAHGSDKSYADLVSGDI